MDTNQPQIHLACKPEEGSGNSFPGGIMVAKDLTVRLDTFMKGMI